MTPEGAFVVLTRAFPRRSISVHCQLSRCCTSTGVYADRESYWVSIVPSVNGQMIFEAETLAEAVRAAEYALEAELGDTAEVAILASDLVGM